MATWRKISAALLLIFMVWLPASCVYEHHEKTRRSEEFVEKHGESGLPLDEIETALFEQIEPIDPDRTEYLRYEDKAKELDQKVAQARSRWDAVPAGLLDRSEKAIGERLTEAISERDSFIVYQKKVIARLRGPFI